MESLKDTMHTKIGFCKSLFDARLSKYIDELQSSNVSQSDEYILSTIRSNLALVVNHGYDHLVDNIKEYFLKNIFKLSTDQNINEVINNVITRDTLSFKSLTKDEVEQEKEKLLEFINKIYEICNKSRPKIIQRSKPRKSNFLSHHINHPLFKSTYLMMLDDDKIEYIPYEIYSDILRGRSTYKIIYNDKTISYLVNTFQIFNRLEIYPPPSWTFLEQVIFHQEKQCLIKFNGPKTMDFSNKFLDAYEASLINLRNYREHDILEWFLNELVSNTSQEYIKRLLQEKLN